MKIFFTILSFTVLFTNLVSAQELPFFSQKFTNGFLYNPSQAGLKSGSVDLSYQKQWSALERNVNNTYLSGQTPLMGGKFGVGGNIFNEKVNFFNYTYLSGSAAYHLGLSANSSISFGLAAEYNAVNLDLKNIKAVEVNDPLITNFPGYNKFDFSFGTTFKIDYLLIGGSVNRIMTLLNTEEQEVNNYFPNLFTGFVSYQIPLASDRDVLEPRLHYRSMVGQVDLMDMGLYYTYNNMITIGGAYRNNATFNIGAGVTLQNFTIAYSRQSFTNEYRSDFGGTDEISLRFVFNENLMVSNLGLNKPSKQRKSSSRSRSQSRNDSSKKLFDRTPKSNVKRPVSKNKNRLKLRNYKGKFKKMKKGNHP
ncbi:MAG: type IX secretion system membrane protein PorP/SprF [Flammeovirgaceae bacterium]|nr:type IX secretion system membrane protein PorP/SprF [Flammeovirgaceae bacterium]